MTWRNLGVQSSSELTGYPAHPVSPPRSIRPLTSEFDPQEFVVRSHLHRWALSAAFCFFAAPVFAQPTWFVPARPVYATGEATGLVFRGVQLSSGIDSKGGERLLATWAAERISLSRTWEINAALMGGGVWGAVEPIAPPGGESLRLVGQIARPEATLLVWDQHPSTTGLQHTRSQAGWIRSEPFGPNMGARIFQLPDGEYALTQIRDSSIPNDTPTLLVAWKRVGDRWERFGQPITSIANASYLSMHLEQIARGRLLAVYVERSFITNRQYVRASFLNDGQWSAPELIAAEEQAPSQVFLGVRAVSLGGGDALIAWQRRSGTHAIDARLYRGGGWQPTQRVKDGNPATSNFEGMEVVGDRSGTAHVIWSPTVDGTNGPVFARTYRDGGWRPIQAIVPVTSTTTAFMPSVAISPDGEVRVLSRVQATERTTDPVGPTMGAFVNGEWQAPQRVAMSDPEANTVPIQGVITYSPVTHSFVGLIEVERRWPADNELWEIRVPAQQPRIAVFSSGFEP